MPERSVWHRRALVLVLGLALGLGLGLGLGSGFRLGLGLGLGLGLALTVAGMAGIVKARSRLAVAASSRHEIWESVPLCSKALLLSIPSVTFQLPALLPLSTSFSSNLVMLLERRRGKDASPGSCTSTCVCGGCTRCEGGCRVRGLGLDGAVLAPGEGEGEGSG